MLADLRCDDTNSSTDLSSRTASVLVDPGETDSIAAGIARVLDNPDLSEELRRRGRQRAAQLSWARAAEATLRIYSEAADGAA